MIFFHLFEFLCTFFCNCKVTFQKFESFPFPGLNSDVTVISVHLYICIVLMFKNIRSEVGGVWRTEIFN